jgi:hypothetical protein
MQKIFLWDKEIHFFDVLRRIIFAKFIENFDYKVQLILSNSSNKTIMWNAYLGIATSFRNASCKTADDTTLASRPVTSFPWRKNSKKSFHICAYLINCSSICHCWYRPLVPCLSLCLTSLHFNAGVASDCCLFYCVLVHGSYVYHKHYCYFL